MVSTPGPSSAGAAPAATAQRAFDTSHDFIAFDFNDDDAGDDDQDDEASGHVTEDRGEGSSRAANAPPRAPQRRGGSPLGDFGSAGRKRKIDDRREDSLKSKKQKAKAAARGTPWCQDVDWERCRNPAEALHRELAAFERWLSPTYEEDETRRMVIQLIRGAITSQWRDAKVYSFGSQDTQLYLPQGDIDLVVVSSSMDRQRRESILRAMAALLRRSNLATNVTVIAKAKVPIIKFVCTYGKYHIDISVNQTNGLQAAQLVKSFLRKNPALRPLIMATKVLLSQRGMSEVYSGGLGSYSVICMCISHLQLHPKIQRREIDPARNLGVLFLELLELYGKNFGYDRTAISIRGSGGYFDKTTRGWLDPRRPYMLCIEDPQDPTNDISKGSFQITAVRTVFAGSFDVLTAAMCERALGGGSRRGGSGGGWNGASGSGSHQRFDEDQEARDAILGEAGGQGGAQPDRDPQSFLGLIFGISRDTIKARKDILDLYNSGTLQFKLGGTMPPRSPPPAPMPSSLRPSQPSSKKTSRAPSEQRLPPTPKAPRADRERAEAARQAQTNGKVSKDKESTSSSSRSAPSSREQTATTSKGVSTSAAAQQGSKIRPILIVDDSTSDEASSRRAQPHRVEELRRTDGAGRDSSEPIAIDDDSESEGEDEGSRYVATSRPSKKLRRSLRGDTARVTKESHIDEDDEEEEEEEGAVSGHFTSAASVSSDDEDEDVRLDSNSKGRDRNGRIPMAATPARRGRPTSSSRRTATTTSATSSSTSPSKAKANANANVNADAKLKLSSKDRLAFWTSKGNAEDDAGSGSDHDDEVRVVGVGNVVVGSGSGGGNGKAKGKRGQ